MNSTRKLRPIDWQEVVSWSESNRSGLFDPLNRYLYKLLRNGMARPVCSAALPVSLSIGGALTPEDDTEFRQDDADRDCLRFGTPALRDDVIKEHRENRKDAQTGQRVRGGGRKGAEIAKAKATKKVDPQDVREWVINYLLNNTRKSLTYARDQARSPFQLSRNTILQYTKDLKDDPRISARS